MDRWTGEKGDRSHLPTAMRLAMSGSAADHWWRVTRAARLELSTGESTSRCTVLGEVMVLGEVGVLVLVGMGEVWVLVVVGVMGEVGVIVVVMFITITSRPLLIMYNVEDIGAAPGGGVEEPGGGGDQGVGAVVVDDRRALAEALLHAPRPLHQHRAQAARHRDHALHSTSIIPNKSSNSKNPTNKSNKSSKYGPASG